MEPTNNYQTLVHDALHAKNMKYVGCFAFNKASEQVQQLGAPILPTLERVLREEVMPYYPSDPKTQVQEFPGASNLLVSYFRIAKEGPLERAAGFFSSLHGPMLAEAIRAVSIVWDHTIPDPFLSTIANAARTGSPQEQEAASWSLGWHHNKPESEQGLAISRNGKGL